MDMDDDRRRALEANYIADFQMLFETRARRNRLLANWAAKRLKRNDEDAYLAEILRAGLAEPGDDDILRKVLVDLRSADIDMSEDEIRERMHEMMFDAAAELDAERSARMHQETG